MVKLTQEDFGTLLICAIRYCHGRQTYMPSTVQSIGKQHLTELTDKDLAVLLNDCKSQEKLDMFGDEHVDKPEWINWKRNLEDEKERRKTKEYDEEFQAKQDLKDKARHYLDQEFKKGDNADKDLIYLLDHLVRE